MNRSGILDTAIQCPVTREHSSTTMTAHLVVSETEDQCQRNTAATASQKAIHLHYIMVSRSSWTRTSSWSDDAAKFDRLHHHNAAAASMTSDLSIEFTIGDEYDPHSRSSIRSDGTPSRIETDHSSTAADDDAPFFVLPKSAVHRSSYRNINGSNSSLVSSSFRDSSCNQKRLLSSSHQHGLYGRREELQTLQQVLTITNNSQQQLVLLAGAAGTGKSTLAAAAVAAVKKKQSLSQGSTATARSILFATGKFDQQRQDEPYAAICAAVRELVAAATSEDEETPLQEQQLTAQDVAILNRWIPGLLGSSHGSPSYETTAAKDDDDDPTAQKFLFHAALSHLVRAVDRSVVLVLDDLQWSDECSLELLQALLQPTTDRSVAAAAKNNNLTVVGIYREDQLEDALVQVLADVEAAASASNCLHVKRIAVGCLAETSIHDMLLDVLNIVASKSSQSLALAKLLHQKTGGNAFYLVQFLQSLVDQQLLTMPVGGTEWEWDVEAIRLRKAGSGPVPNAGLAGKHPGSSSFGGLSGVSVPLFSIFYGCLEQSRDSGWDSSRRSDGRPRKSLVRLC